jgi:hypothetical protein
MFGKFVNEISNCGELIFMWNQQFKSRCISLRCGGYLEPIHRQALLYFESGEYIAEFHGEHNSNDTASAESAVE